MRLFGPPEGGQLAGAAARLIGMQYHAETATLLGLAGGGPEAFAEYLATMGRGQGSGQSTAPRAEAQGG